VIKQAFEEKYELLKKLVKWPISRFSNECFDLKYLLEQFERFIA